MKPLKQKKCKWCKSLFTPKNTMQKTCSVHCAYAYAKGQREKSEAKENRKRKKELNKNDKSWMRARAQTAFNAYIRKRDEKEPCISCGRFHQGQYHAGHYRTRGTNPELAFNELNCHKQCSACNNHLSGNLVNYRRNLVDKIGQDKLEWLEGPHEPKKYTLGEYEEIYQTYKKKLKDLVK